MSFIKEYIKVYVRDYVEDGVINHEKVDIDTYVKIGDIDQFIGKFSLAYVAFCKIAAVLQRIHDDERFTCYPVTVIDQRD